VLCKSKDNGFLEPIRQSQENYIAGFLLNTILVHLLKKEILSTAE